MLEKTKAFTLSDWSLLWATFFRMERQYRQMGKEGLRKWAQLKVLIWLYCYAVPIRAGDLVHEIGVSEEVVLEAVSALTKQLLVIEVGFYQGIKALSDIQKNIQLTNAGRLEVIKALDDAKESLGREMASVAGWRTKGI